MRDIFFKIKLIYIDFKKNLKIIMKKYTFLMVCVLRWSIKKFIIFIDHR